MVSQTSSAPTPQKCILYESSGILKNDSCTVHVSKNPMAPRWLNFYHWCPKLSRFKVGLLLILIAAGIFLTFFKINAGYSSVGASRSSPVDASIVAEDAGLTDSPPQLIPGPHIMKSLHQLDTTYNTSSPDLTSAHSNRQRHRQMIEANNNGRGENNTTHSGKLRAKHTQRHLPQCIIIGMRKAGTRALLTYLNLHPQIITATKEMHFFNTDDYNRGLDWYRKHMPPTYEEVLVIEKTPAYFTYSLAPERIYSMNHSVKLLLIVRNPIDRAVSDYLQINIKQKRNGLHTHTFEKSIFKSDGSINRSFPPLRRSFYWQDMQNWLQYFPLAQIHLVDGDKMLKNPLAEIQKVETFLSLEHRISKNNFFYNEAKGFFCIRNETAEKCLVASKGRPHPKLDPQILRQLQEMFRPQNEKFFELVQRRFDW